MICEDEQVVLLEERFFHGLIRGHITAVLHVGDRAVSPGRLVFMPVREGYRPVPVYVDRVIDTTFAEIDDYDAILAGYENGDAARQAILYFQPAIVGSTPVAVIRFERD